MVIGLGGVGKAAAFLDGEYKGDQEREDQIDNFIHHIFNNIYQISVECRPDVIIHLLKNQANKLEFNQINIIIMCIYNIFTSIFIKLQMQTQQVFNIFYRIVYCLIQLIPIWNQQPTSPNFFHAFLTLSELQSLIFISQFKKSNMFVSTTLHNCLDKLAVHSTLSGKSGLLVGTLFSIIFVILVIVLFIGPVVRYLDGDFVQASFRQIKGIDIEMYSGCDFKMAFALFDNKTRQIVDSRELLNMFSISVYYASPDGDQFTAQVEPCDNEYFSGYDLAPNLTQNGACYRIPDKIGYFSELIGEYVSVIGFLIIPKCNDPFTCTINSEHMEQLQKKKLEFFESHYYQFYFTSQELDDQGNVQAVFKKVYSKQHQSHATIIPDMRVIYEVQKAYIDRSVMPWRENVEHTLTTWFGLIQGITSSEQQLLGSGYNMFIFTNPSQDIVFRQYKKLDQILGMIGGGIFLLFIIFYFPCSYLSRVKSEKKVCESMLIFRDFGHSSEESLHKVQISNGIYLTKWLPNCLKFHKKQKSLLEIGNRYVDIVNLVKKQKVALKNIRLHKRHYSTNKSELQFSKRALNFEYQEQFQGYNEKYQLKTPQLKCLQANKDIPSIYYHNATVLSLREQPYTDKNLKELQDKYEVYSKEKKSFKSSYRTLCKKIKIFLADLIRKFDIFGAKPMMDAHPMNYSYISTTIVLLIIVLSCLTFALTIHNMDKTKIKLEQQYISPQNYQINMTANKNYKFLFCPGQFSIDNGLLLGESRIGDIKFYQTTKGIDGEKTTYYNPIWIGDEPGKYFDITNELYEGNDFKYCFKPPFGVQFSAFGSTASPVESYFGVVVRPYCSGTISFCEEKKNQTLQDFQALFNSERMIIALPDSKYIPQVDQILDDPKFILSNKYNSNQPTNIEKGIETTIYHSVIELVDDTQTWIVGDPPQPIYKTMSVKFDDIDQTIKMIDEEFSYKVKIKLSGEVLRVIKSNYKLDFLIATIGGCFMLFYLIFGCFGKMANNYFMKARLAKELYSETDESETFSGCLKACLKCCRMPCTDSSVIKKVETDLNFISMAQKVDNMYRLSSVFHNSLPTRQLSLIYLKQMVKQNDELVNPFIDEEEEEDQQEQLTDAQIQYMNIIHRTDQEQLEHQSVHGRNFVSNTNNHNQDQQVVFEKLLVDSGPDLEKEDVTNELNKANREKEKCRKLIENLNLFKENAYLTLDGKRQIKSVCGGVFCILLLVLIILLTQHYLTIYFNANDYILSYQKAVFDENDDEQNQRIDLTVGKDFKFIVSFITKDDYTWQDVSSYIEKVGLSLKKIRTQKVNGQYQTNVEIIDLIKCPSNYIDGFTSHQDGQQYENLTLGYCIPDGVTLALSGNMDDDDRQYFKVSIYNKQGTKVERMLVQQLLGKYLPTYHMSNPIQDFKQFANENSTRYSMDQIRTNFDYQKPKSEVQNNITLVKTLVNYDTAIHPSLQYPSISTYKLQKWAQQPSRVSSQFHGVKDIKNQIFFEQQKYISLYTPRRIKANELFGIIGGAILFVFIGIGIFPKSFNEFRMRVIIGSKLYTIYPDVIKQKKKVLRKSGVVTKSNDVNSKNLEEKFHEFNDISEWRIFKGWVLSFWGFVRQDFTKTKTMKMIAHLESRASRDINILHFYKNMFKIQSYINSVKELKVEEGINLCRVFPKISIPSDLKYKSFESNQIDKDLRYLAKKNDFSDWDVNAIKKAKLAHINPKYFFEQRSLDSYFKQGEHVMQERSSNIDNFSSFQRIAEYNQERVDDDESQNSHNVDLPSHDIE